jgi:hypothetical protein
LPIPKRNIVKNENDTLKEATSRIFNNYEQEFAEYEEFRELYRTLGLKTLAAEAEGFYCSISLYYRPVPARSTIKCRYRMASCLACDSNRKRIESHLLDRVAAGVLKKHRQSADEEMPVARFVG